MSANDHFAKLDQAIRKYIRSDKVQRELFRDIAVTFLRNHSEVRSSIRFNGYVSAPTHVEVDFSDIFVDSVIAVIADEFKK